MTLTAVDDADGDGVASITYALADANATTVPGDRATLVIRSQGTTRVRYFATDRAGNAESVHELGVRIEHPPPAASPSPAAPVPAGMPAKPTPPLAAATLPSNRACVSRRSFRIRLARPPNDPATRAVVTVNGKRVKVVRGARLTAPVDLRGLPKGKVTVKVVLTTRSGKRLTASRTYRTCVPKRPRRRGL